MTIIEQLKSRADACCELCKSPDNNHVFSIAPSDNSLEQSAFLCETCIKQIELAEDIDVNHWRCLNDSMWSQVPAVQVLAWRQLNALSKQGENWAQDLLEMLYLEDDVLQWAKASHSSSEDEDQQSPTLDSNGTALQTGDTVTLIKDLPVKGAGFTAKRGTAVRNIALTDNPEHIEGRVNGQRIVLLSCYLKKQ